MVHQKRCKLRDKPPTIKAKTTVDGRTEIKTIENQISCRLLGINIQNDLTWKAHLESGEKALLPTLRRRLGALRHMGRDIPLKGRQILANGLILSKIIYMIPVWGGACETQLMKVQTLLNNTARFVHRRGRRSNVRKLMEDSKWMTVKEMARFHCIVTLWKIRKYGVPQQLANLYTVG